MAQAVEHQPSKYESLNSNPVLPKKEKSYEEAGNRQEYKWHTSM
jgi:hypothetical protein